LDLGLFSIADVARDLRRADDDSAIVEDRRNSEGDREGRTVLALPNRLEVVDFFTAANVADDIVLLGLAIRRDDAPDRLPDHLLRGIAEHPLRCPVPRGDDAVEVFADDCVVAGFDDRGKTPCLEALNFDIAVGHGPNGIRVR